MFREKQGAAQNDTNPLNTQNQSLITQPQNSSVKAGKDNPDNKNNKNNNKNNSTLHRSKNTHRKSMKSFCRVSTSRKDCQVLLIPPTNSDNLSKI